MSRITDVEYIKKVIPEIIRRLISFDGVKKIIIFGSVADKKTTPDSDLDLLVIKDSVKSKHREMVDLRKSLRGLGIPIDLLIVEEFEFQNRIQQASNIYYWANRNGKVVYDTI